MDRCIYYINRFGQWKGAYAWKTSSEMRNTDCRASGQKFRWTDKWRDIYLLYDNSSTITADKDAPLTVDAGGERTLQAILHMENCCRQKNQGDVGNAILDTKVIAIFSVCYKQICVSWLLSWSFHSHLTHVGLMHPKWIVTSVLLYVFNVVLSTSPFKVRLSAWDSSYLWTGPLCPVSVLTQVSFPRPGPWPSKRYWGSNCRNSHIMHLESLFCVEVPDVDILVVVCCDHHSVVKEDCPNVNRVL